MQLQKYTKTINKIFKLISSKLKRRVKYKKLNVKVGRYSLERLLKIINRIKKLILTYKWLNIILLNKTIKIIWAVQALQKNNNSLIWTILKNSSSNKGKYFKRIYLMKFLKIFYLHSAFMKSIHAKRFKLIYQSRTFFKKSLKLFMKTYCQNLLTHSNN